VKGRGDLVRDPLSNAIINNDIKGYEAAIAAHNRMKADKQRISDLEHKVDNINNDLYDIKDMLKQLLGK
tara:strand:- start:1350 stop:1556 length:207 start_codon:yes stop_codon:yes gene_type:complete